MVTLPVMMPKSLGIPPTDNMLACLENQTVANWCGMIAVSKQHIYYAFFAACLF